MSDQKYECPYEGCTRSFFTQTGLDVHAAQHVAESKPQPKVDAPKPKKEAPKAKPKKEKDDVVPIKEMSLKESEKRWKDRIKTMRKSLPKFKESYTRSEFAKILYLDGDDLQKLKGSKFELKEVREMKNGWYSITAFSLDQKVMWREGPIKGRWHVTFPRLY